MIFEFEFVAFFEKHKYKGISETHWKIKIEIFFLLTYVFIVLSSTLKVLIY